MLRKSAGKTLPSESEVGGGGDKSAEGSDNEIKADRVDRVGLNSASGIFRGSILKSPRGATLPKKEMNDFWRALGADRARTVVSIVVCRVNTSRCCSLSSLSMRLL
jgi:hypothetical protein